MSIRCDACEEENRDGATYCLACGSRLEASDDPLLGKLIHDRYRVLSALGEGGMGRVYLAEQQMGTASRKVAVKILHAGHSRDERIRTRFYRECEVVIQLNHPNTIHFHDFGALENGQLFIVMEYVEGPSLEDALREGAFPLARIDRLLPQIVGSLQEAHDAQVVHRDLKPANILLTTRGGQADFVKVCDFGIAKRRSPGAPELTLEGTVIGTPQYMSPEQLTGAPVDTRSDIYSLGLIVFEMLTGERPYPGRTPLEWITKHTTADPPSFGQYPSTSELGRHRIRAVHGALAKAAGDRPASARAFEAEFLGAGVAHSPGGGSVRRTWLLAAALFAVGFATVGGAALLFLEGARRAPVVVPPETAHSDAGADGGEELGPGEEGQEWVRIVHYQRQVEDAARALGEPDGRSAVIAPGGAITLELRAGRRIASDGGPEADLTIVVDEANSGPYRAEVGQGHEGFVTVGSELLGRVALDTDQFEVRRIRYVRVKNRGQRAVHLDAVGAARTAAP